jgi:hypothetical protein
MLDGVVEPSGTVLAPDATGACVLAEGELTGHRHAIYDRVTMFRDDSLAREIPTGLYVGHVRVEGGSALIHHQEHAPISLAEGTYRVRRQRELEPRDAVLVSDWGRSAAGTARRLRQLAPVPSAALLLLAWLACWLRRCLMMTRLLFPSLVFLVLHLALFALIVTIVAADWARLSGAPLGQGSPMRKSGLVPMAPALCPGETG